MKMVIMKNIFLTIFMVFVFILNATNINAQKIPMYYKNLINVDSILINNPNPVIFLREVNVYPRKRFDSRAERKSNKLERNFKKVYPVALRISKLYNQINDSLYSFNTDKERKKYMKTREKQIMAQYKPELIKLTISQSILLVKLLDRETGNTAFEIVDELKGSIKAFFWQGFAKIFGNDLKKQYDSEYKDKEIEYLVRRYKEGSL